MWTDVDFTFQNFFNTSLSKNRHQDKTSKITRFGLLFSKSSSVLPNISIRLAHASPNMCTLRNWLETNFKFKFRDEDVKLMHDIHAGGGSGGGAQAPKRDADSPQAVSPSDSDCQGAVPLRK